MKRASKRRQTVSAAQFKAECLALFDRVAESHEVYIVTKRGRPVAQVVPIESEAAGPLAGSVTVLGDIVGPVLGDWDVER
jgi:prevent-host-death family protein